MTAGTYYVEELGHTDSAIGELYYCSGVNPQKVTVTAGAAATVSFTNRRNTGGVKLVKEGSPEPALRVRLHIPNLVYVRLQLPDNGISGHCVRG